MQQQEAAFHEVTEALQGNLTHLKREVTEHRDEILASDAALRAELANRLENLRKDCVESLALKDDEGVKVLLFVYFYIGSIIIEATVDLGSFLWLAGQEQ